MSEREREGVEGGIVVLGPADLAGRIQKHLIDSTMKLLQDNNAVPAVPVFVVDADALGQASGALALFNEPVGAVDKSGVLGWASAAGVVICDTWIRDNRAAADGIHLAVFLRTQVRLDLPICVFITNPIQTEIDCVDSLRSSNKNTKTITQGIIDGLEQGWMITGAATGGAIDKWLASRVCPVTTRARTADCLE